MKRRRREYSQAKRLAEQRSANLRLTPGRRASTGERQSMFLQCAQAPSCHCAKGSTRQTYRQDAFKIASCLHLTQPSLFLRVFSTPSVHLLAVSLHDDDLCWSPVA